jgi:hypothetical protein
MKIYERDFVEVLFRRSFERKYTLETRWSWAKRRELFNNSDYKIVDRSFIEEYSPNAPVNVELPATSFPEHESFIGTASISGRPWLKYRMRNGRKYVIQNSSPLLRFEYTKGFNDILNSSVDFDRIEFGFKHQLRLGVRGTLFTSFRAGMFLNADSVAFMDYKHFIGNQTALMTTDPAGSFRLMDYYLFSTKEEYFEANLYYQFRKFLVTTFPYTRLLGIRESVFTNYLATPSSRNYVEVGYAVEGILRLFRVEIAAGFRDGKYVDYGVRIGIATTLTTEFSDN